MIIFFICWRPLGDPDPAPYNLGLAVLVIIVILLQASFSAFQDWSTAKTMNSILDLLPSDVHVLRDGSFTTVATSDLVVGDIVNITDGPFKGFDGAINEIDAAKGKLKVLVNMFGRETLVELDGLQVKRV